MTAPSSQVRKVHFDTQDYGPQAITGLEPKDVPLLHQQQNKGSLEWENFRHVSGRPRRGPGAGQRDQTHLLLLTLDRFCAGSPEKPKGGPRAAKDKNLGKATDLIFGISKTATKRSFGASLHASEDLMP